MIKDKIKIVGFDADDTLWINEPYFTEAEYKFCLMMENFLTIKESAKIINKKQIDNLPLYGYGIKSFILSMIESANIITDNNVDSEVVNKILDIGKELLCKPVVLIDQVEEVLGKLQSKYKLIVVTKGDLKDQHEKLHNSGIGPYFHHIEVMSEKTEEDYTKMLKRLEIKEDEFIMIGNSLRSDILPVINIGGNAVHIPFHTTWAHERIDIKIDNPNFWTLEKISDINGMLL